MRKSGNYIKMLFCEDFLVQKNVRHYFTQIEIYILLWVKEPGNYKEVIQNEKSFPKLRENNQLFFCFIEETVAVDNLSVHQLLGELLLAVSLPVQAWGETQSMRAT